MHALGRSLGGVCRGDFGPCCCFVCSCDLRMAEARGVRVCVAGGTQGAKGFELVAKGRFVLPALLACIVTQTTKHLRKTSVQSTGATHTFHQVFSCRSSFQISIKYFLLEN